MNKKPNIILITIDSLRADHCGFMGYEKNITPNLDALAKESIVFTNAFATGPVTPHSFPGILTSTYPLDFHGPGKIERPRVLISEVLKKEGYITAAFHSNPFLSSYFGYNKGWDVFEDIAPIIEKSELDKKEDKEKKFLIFKKILKLGKELSFSFWPQPFFWFKYLSYKRKPNLFVNKIKITTNSLNQIVKDFINSMNSQFPFFIWIHYMDVHQPYRLKKNYSSNLALSFYEFLSWNIFTHLRTYPNKKALLKFAQNLYSQKLIHLYDEGIKYLDEKLKELFEFLKEKKLWGRTIIFLTSDHGEEFFEHQGCLHSPKLYNELLQVPLLIHFPNSKGKIIERQVSLIDLAPTICEILKIPKIPQFKGKSLFSENNSPLYFQTASRLEKSEFHSHEEWFEIKELKETKMALLFQNYKYIIDGATHKEELYDLSKDSKEKVNISSSKPKIIFQMRKLIQEFKKNNPPLEYGR